SARATTAWRAKLAKLCRSAEWSQMATINLSAFLKRHWLSFSGAGLVLIATGSFILYRANLAHQVQRELKAVQQRGEPVLASDIQKWRPPIAAAENAGTQIRIALSTLVPARTFGGTNLHWITRAELAVHPSLLSS